MTNIKDFLTSDLPPSEVRKEFYDRMKEIEDEFVTAAPQLQELLATIQSGQPVSLETRTINISMPTSFWNTLERFTEVFERRREFGIHDPEDQADVIQDNIARVYREQANATIAEAVISQMILDAMMSFTATMVRGKFLEGLERAIETGDPERLKDFLKNNAPAGVKLDFESDSEDFDPEA